ncbi:MAG: dTDP-4-dehydrorhamnose 3,5-epimerase [Patescibacteria group bacterium]
MEFTKTSLNGAYLIELEKRVDERGFFARTWCADEFAKAQLKTNLVPQNMSFTQKAGTLRGLHFQKEPHAETKVVRCTKGKIYDVIIDLRPESATHKQWFGIELSADNYKMLYIPEGFAHGFVTLEDNCEVTYLVTAFYTPSADSGVRYNDPVFNIKWPVEVKYVSKKDKSFPDYVPSFRG